MQKIIAKIAGVALVAAFAVTAASPAAALTAADIQLLVSLGVIPADKADAAMALVTGGTQAVTVPAASCGVYARDLTLGSTGADVVSLQTFLVAQGNLVMPAGVSMGYFGTLTQSALASYQAANGIAPAVGYFGPITRANVQAKCVATTPTTPTTPGTTTGTLGAGEASLRSYSATSKYSNEDVYEGETQKVFAAEFDVRDGDAMIERVDVRVESVGTTNESSPWRHIDQVAIYMNGERVARMDADSQNDWSRQSSEHSPAGTRAYELRFTGLSEIFRDGDNVELEIEITAKDVVSNKPQQWRVWVPRDGIRAIDGEGINQYAGSNDATKDFEVLAAREGSLSIRENQNDPDPTILVVDQNNRSEEFEVFRFDIRNRDADTFLNTMNIVASTSAANINNVVSEVRINVGGTNYRYDSASTTAGNVGEYLFDFEDGRNQVAVDENETVTVRVMARFNKLSGNYTEGTMVQFGIGRIDGNTYGSGFLTAESQSMGDPSTVSGEIEGSIHTLRATGVAVEAISATTSYRNTNPGTATNIQYGVFEFEIQVTALEDDAFIPNFVGTTSSTTAGFVVAVTDAGTPFTGTTTAFISKDTAQGVPATTNNRHRIAEGTSARFTVRVELDPTGAASGKAYGVRLDTIRFSSTSAGSLAAFTVPVTGDFETGRITID